ncbi:hypothetical protein MNBD_GAMMA24-2438 [hydrothermal vent metagenome]|uniref:Uncharacterized protein n=1 Tax=hydrothermal vent metagenome TaxID=652676 RepID=A0A3B1BII5_9ZZZZ
MDEEQYHAMYRSLNQQQCVFEKAISARRSNCNCATRFNLADREGIACNSLARYEHCLRLLQQLRKNASFALHLTHVDGQLAHALEMKLQVGGLSGLEDVVLKGDPAAADMNDINGLLNAAKQQFGRIEDLPYTDIIKSIVHFKGRQRRRR